MYDLHDYARMISDEARMIPHVRALERAVHPGCVVADVGAGTGIFALIACRLGARRVFAIETSDLIEIARELARENGVADRIVFFHEDARKVDLRERVDVMISDLRGALPLFGDHLAILADARDRFLKPAGTLIPRRDRLIVSVVDQAELFGRALGPSIGPLGVTLEAMRARLRHAPFRDRPNGMVAPSNLLAEGVPWATLDYASVRPGPVKGAAEVHVRRSGTGHGLVVWFEAFIEGEPSFSSAPGEENSYGLLFLPWPRPVALSVGDVIAVELFAQANGAPWGWNSLVKLASGAVETFKQSSFLSVSSRPLPRHSLASLSHGGRS